MAIAVLVRYRLRAVVVGTISMEAVRLGSEMQGTTVLLPLLSPDAGVLLPLAVEEEAIALTMILDQDRRMTAMDPLLHVEIMTMCLSVALEEDALFD